VKKVPIGAFNYFGGVVREQSGRKEIKKKGKRGV